MAPPRDEPSLRHDRGLAELAFGSLTDAGGLTQGRHLALLRAETLELDLTDPEQRQFGDYELLERIGEGGMGVVYRARQQSLDREVAVKLLSAGPWASREFIARFEREAQNAARMQHPNIVGVHEVGNRDGLYYFSMQLVEGESLSAALKRGEHVAPKAAAALMRTVAEAVAYAHSLGVLHLDLKPGNVLIDRDGTAHVADFGLARRLDSTLAIDNDEVSGTPSYMAPEQAQVRAHKLTAATDIWSLGAILYELLAGEPPFRADTAQATLQLVLEGRVRAPRRWRPSVPLDLQAIALRCLSRDPGERYRSARALADDLGRFVEGRPVQARPLNVLQRGARWGRREPKLAATALLAFGLLVIGLAATTQQWRRADANAETAQANAATASQRLWDSRRAAALAATETRNDWEAAPLLLANLAEMEAQGDDVRAAGERRRLGIIRNANAVLIDAIRVQPRAVALAFDPEGKRVAVSGEETGVRIFDVARGSETVRTPNREHQVLSRVHFTDGGRTLIGSIEEISAKSPRPAGGGSLRLDVARGVWLDPPAGFANLATASYSADGRYAVLTAKDRRAQFWATDSWRPLGPLAQLPYTDADNARLIAPDGHFFALAGPLGAVTLVDGRSMRPTRVPLPEFGRIAAWAISPDSRWIALGDFEGHVVVVDSATLATHTLQPRPAHGARWLTFSADGGWLALAAKEGGVYLWSWPEGRLLVPPFSGSASLDDRPLAERVELDRARNLVLVSDETANTSIWQVAPTTLEGDISAARRITAAIDPRESWGVEAVAWNPGAGLLASVADQRLRLERLRAPALRPGQGAPLQPGTLRFDGQRLVEVEGNEVRVVDAISGRPLGKSIRFAQPPGFAELTPDGATLVVIADRTLHALAAISGKPKFEPVELANTPAVIDLSPDGGRVAIGWLANDPSVDRVTSEMVVIHSVADGRRIAGPVALPGPTNETLVFTSDGSRLLVWNPRELSLRDGTTLAPVPGPLADFRPRGRDPNSHHGFLASVVPDPAGGVVLIQTRNDGSDWHHQLRRYPRDGEPAISPLSSMSPSLEVLPLPDGQGTVVTSDYTPLTRVVAPDGRSRELPDVGDDTVGLPTAVSPDGRWLARVRRDGVALFDLRVGTRVTTLHVALPRPDQVRRLAFSPDGNRLLARSMRNRQVVWDLTSDARSVAAIARGLGLRDVTGMDSSLGAEPTRDPDAAQRARLRADDPGVPPNFAVDVRAGRPDARAIPVRDPATPAAAIDLTPWYTFGLGDPAATPPAHGDFGWLPAGMQRFQNVDYDVRGGVGLERGRRVHIGVDAAHGGRRFNALNVLVVPGNRTRTDTIAVIALHYADGRHVDLPLGIADDALDYWREPGSDESVRFATYGFDSRIYEGPGERGRSYALAFRMANPRPGQPVTALTLRAAEDDPDAAPVVLAITLQSDPAGAGKPAANRSR
ncbi:MAG: WD40 repeat domain-containing serine/threonine protein kinase [Rhodanobacteraceae bacterium]